MNPAISNPSLIQDVIAKRCLALLIDVCAILMIWLVLGVFLGVFGLLTLGLGWHLFGLMPLVPFFYHFLTLGRFGATPGQHAMGLCVRRVEDLGMPTWLQAFISVLCFYATLALSGILLLVALATEGHRTLHDLAAGLIVVRADALGTAPTTYRFGRFSL